MTERSQDELAGVERWLRDQAASKTLPELFAWVSSKQTDLLSAIRSCSEQALTQSASEGEWSPIQAFKHVVEWNHQVGEDVLNVCLTGERPGNPLPEFEANRDALITRQQDGLTMLWAHVSEADPESFLSVTWPHPFFGELNWREWFLFVGVHCADHAAQIRAAGNASA